MSTNKPPQPSLPTVQQMLIVEHGTPTQHNELLRKLYEERVIDSMNQEYRTGIFQKLHNNIEVEEQLILGLMNMDFLRGVLDLEMHASVPLDMICNHYHISREQLILLTQKYDIFELKTIEGKERFVIDLEKLTTNHTDNDPTGFFRALYFSSHPLYLLNHIKYKDNKEIANALSAIRSDAQQFSAWCRNLLLKTIDAAPSFSPTTKK